MSESGTSTQRTGPIKPRHRRFVAGTVAVFLFAIQLLTVAHVSGGIDHHLDLQNQTQEECGLCFTASHSSVDVAEHITVPRFAWQVVSGEAPHTQTWANRVRLHHASRAPPVLQA